MEAEREKLLGEIDRALQRHREIPCGCAADGSRCLLHEELIDVEARRRFAFKEQFRATAEERFWLGGFQRVNRRRSAAAGGLYSSMRFLKVNCFLALSHHGSRTREPSRRD